MRIHRVRIDNFRGLRDFDVSFCDASGQPRPLTVLVGPNMSGKTTVLDALHLVYALAEDSLNPKLRRGFDLRPGAVLQDTARALSVDLDFSVTRDEIAAMDKVDRIAVLGDDEEPVAADASPVTVTLRWPPQKQVFDGKQPLWPLRFRHRALRAIERRLAGEAEIEHVGGVLYLDQHRTVELTVPSTDTGPENELRERAGTGDVMPWLELASRLDQKWDVTTQGESAWARVKRLYAELAAPATIDDIVATDQGFDLRLRCGERVYYASGVSSGERQMLRLAATLTALRAVRSVVLIDELELHLHPRWQRNLLHFCRRGGGGDNQFIVTTHSSSVLDYVDPADVVRLGGEL